MPGQQDECVGGGDGDPIGAGFLIIPTSTGKYGRLWRRGWNVRRFLAALCKEKASVQIGGVPFLLQSPQPSRTFSSRSLQACDDNGVPPASSTTVPLLQSEEFGNGDSSAECHLGANSEETDTGHKPNSTDNGSSASVFRRLQSQLSGALSDSGDRGAPSPATEPLLQSGEPNEETSSTDQNDKASTGNGSPPVISRVQSRPMRLASSSARESQLAIEAPKKIHSDTVSDAHSPSPTAPLLRREPAQAHVAVDFGSDDAEDKELQRKIAGILEEKNVELLRASGGTEELARAFGSDLVSGKNAECGESVVTYKKLVLVKDFPRFFIRACNSYTIFLLIISACFSLVFEMMEKSPKKGWRDGAATFLAASLIVTADSVSSFRRERKQEKNMLNERGIKMTVIRSGQQELVPIYGIVKGDILCLEKDQTVPVDGLLVDGSIVVDGRSDKNIDPHQNPFLFSGSMVVEGEGGRMLATSVGANAVSFKEALLESRISKPNSWAEFFSLCMALLIVLVLFLRFLRRKHVYGDDGGSSQIKGEVTVQTVLKIFERMFLKPRGTISILTSSLAAVVIGIQHGMLFVISISLAYWNEKNTTEDVELQNLSACGTMGLVTVICFDISGGLLEREAAFEDGIESMKAAVGAFKMAKIDIKLVSGDDGLPALTQIACDLGIFTVDTIDHEAVEGQAFRNMDNNERKTQADKIKVMANFLPKDKLSMVQCLKEKGHVVAFYGGSTARDATALKAADVGISDQNSAGMAKKCSGIIIGSHRSFNSLIRICKCGRWAYYNIQKFIQLQLIVMVSSLVITSVATVALRGSSITLIQLIWVNLITSILGGLMLVTDPQGQELDRLQAAGNRNEPVITKAMWVYILTQILYQASVLLVLHFKGQSIPGINRRVRKAMVFNSFVLCQIFNYANAMELEKKGRNGIKQKGLLVMAVWAAVGVQMLVAEIWARLNWWQWGVCFMIAALPWGLELGMKTLSPYIPDCWSFSSISSQIRRSAWMPSRHDFCFIIFSSLFFLF